MIASRRVLSCCCHFECCCNELCVCMHRIGFFRHACELAYLIPFQKQDFDGLTSIYRILFWNSEYIHTAFHFENNIEKKSGFSRQVLYFSCAFFLLPTIWYIYAYVFVVISLHFKIQDFLRIWCGVRSSIKLMKIQCVMKIRAVSSRKLRVVVVAFWGAFHVDFCIGFSFYLHLILNTWIGTDTDDFDRTVITIEWHVQLYAISEISATNDVAEKWLAKPFN